MAGLIRVLVVDDSALMRKMIKAILETDREIEVVGTARDGEDALRKDEELKPDVVTMDINMPVMDGITSMMLLFEQHPDVKVVMVSSLTQEGALTTFEALELGAFDYVAKPSGTVSTNLYEVGKELILKVKAAAKYGKRRRRLSSPEIGVSPPASRKIRRTKGSRGKPSLRPKLPAGTDTAQKLVVIGVSTGGPSTLMEILPRLPADLDAAVIIVQHMPSAFTNTFARRLDQYSAISIKEAEQGDRLLKGCGLVAPGGSHLVLKRNAMRDEAMVRITNAIEDAIFVPSVDVTMKSAVEFFGSRIVGVLLTGMGSDGAEGMMAIKEAGGITIAEDESTAIVWGMPREAIERGAAKVVAPAHHIAGEIVKAVNNLPG